MMENNSKYSSGNSGWEKVCIGELGKVITGNTPPTSKPELYGDILPWITPSDIAYGRYPMKKAKKLSALGIDCIRRIPANSVLVTCIASIGKNAIAPYELATNQQINSIIPSKKVNAVFLYYLMEHIAPYISRLAGFTAVPILNKSGFESIPIYLPPLKEQKAIASTLELWDIAIEKTERLIAAKEKHFKWLLKTLISDQQNNPDWGKIKLGDAGVISSAGIDKKIIKNEESVKLINYMDVLKKDFIYSKQLNHWVTAPKNKAFQCNVEKGDVFFTPSSEIKGDIAHSAVAMEDIDKGVYSYHIVRFRLKENWNILFRAYIFKSSHFYRQATRLCEGSGQRYVISQRYFRDMTIYVPPITEQIKIAKILSLIKKEITTLQNISEKYRTQKRGLMQKLLKGA